MAVIENVIRTTFEGIDKSMKKTAESAQLSIMGLKKSQQMLNSVFDVGMISAEQYASATSDVSIQTEIMKGRYNAAIQTLKKFDPVTKRITDRFLRFRMELLSVMFFGMGIQRTFMGLLKPSLELTGVFEIMNETLGVFFLPIAMLLQEVMLAISEVLLSLPEPVQNVIGVLVLLGVIFGGLLMTFGALGLGIGGLNTLFFGTAVAAGTAGTASAAAGGGIMAALAPLLPIILAIGVAVAVFVFLWQTNMFGFRDAVSGAIGVVIEVLKGLWKVVEFVFGTIVQILRFAWAIIKIPLGFIEGILSGFIHAIFPGVGSAWDKLWNGIKGVLGWVWGFIKPIFEAIKGFMEFIINSANAVGGFAKGIGETIGRFFGGGGTTKMQYGGIVPGQMGEPVPIIAHGGERFLGTRGGAAGTVINFSPTINISGAGDKDELERMIKENNTAMIDELKRMVQ